MKTILNTNGFTPIHAISSTASHLTLHIVQAQNRSRTEYSKCKWLQLSNRPYNCYSHLNNLNSKADRRPFSDFIFGASSTVWYSLEKISNDIQKLVHLPSPWFFKISLNTKHPPTNHVQYIFIQKMLFSITGI